MLRSKILERYRILKLYSVLRPHWRLLALVLSLSLLGIALSVVSPLLTRAIVDEGILRGDLGAIARYAAALAALSVASTVVGAVSGLYQSILSGRVALDLRSKVFAGAMELGVELYQEGAQVGDVVARLYGYVDLSLIHI